jgi:CheY-like chemotaxis protein
MGMQSRNDALDLSQMNALVVDADPYATEMLARIMRGFGLKNHSSAFSGESAIQAVAEKKPDLVLVESRLPDMTGSDVIKRIRREENPLIRHMPLIIMTGHTVMADIEMARNSGANIVIKKPVSAAILFDRILWAASTDRDFIETPSYVGPDRRFKSLGPPNGIGRRSTDLSAEVGAASEPNLAQSEIDAFIKPVKIKLE